MTAAKKKDKLNRYLLLRLENELQLQKLEKLQASRKRKRTDDSGLNGRLDDEPRLKAIIETNLDEMEAVCAAIENIRDPMERMVLRMRYVDGNGVGKRMKWEDIAAAIYGSCEDGQMTAVFRLHGQALKNLRF